jgi:cell division protein FtsA
MQQKNNTNTMNTTTPYILAFDLGTTKIIGAVAQKTTEGKLTIVAYEEEETKPTTIKQGAIFNVADTAFIISSIVTKLRNKTKLNLSKAYIGIGGRYLRCRENTTKRTLGINEIVEESLLEKLYNENFKLKSTEFDILDVITQEYLVDDEWVADPAGIACAQIEGRYKIIYTRSEINTGVNKVKELLKEKSHLEIIGTFPSPVATSHGLMSEDEKDLGCMIIDFGGSTTSYSVFTKNYLREIGVIPFGAKTITNDIRELNVTEQQAEKLKQKLGNAMAALEVPDKKIIIAKAAYEQEEKSIQSTFLAQIIEARASEILNLIIAPLKQKGYLKQLGAGIIITGGGAQLKNMRSLVQSLSGVDVRTSAGTHLLTEDSITDDLRKPSYSQVIGLLSMGTENCVSDKIEEIIAPVKTVKKTGKNLLFRVVDKASQGLSGLFDDNSDKID